MLWLSGRGQPFVFAPNVARSVNCPDWAVLAAAVPGSSVERRPAPAAAPAPRMNVRLSKRFAPVSRVSFVKAGAGRDHRNI